MNRIEPVTKVGIRLHFYFVGFFPKMSHFLTLGVVQNYIFSIRKDFVSGWVGQRCFQIEKILKFWEDSRKKGHIKYKLAR